MVVVTKNAVVNTIIEPKELKLDMIFNKPKRILVCEHCGHIGEVCEIELCNIYGTLGTKPVCEKCGSLLGESKNI